MCGRYTLTLSDEELARRYGVVPLFALPRRGPRSNIKPTDPVAIIMRPEGGTPQQSGTAQNTGSTPVLAEARWSLTPAWSETLAVSYPTFNARSETVLEKPAFRDAALRQRCLIPASGYYEWKTEGRQKTPHYIFDPGGSPLLFAGLYSRWTDPRTGESTLTATILTAAASGRLAALHDRMPIFTAGETAAAWLQQDTVTDTNLLIRITNNAAEIGESLVYHAVAPLRGDGPELILPTNSATAEATLF